MPVRYDAAVRSSFAGPCHGGGVTDALTLPDVYNIASWIPRSLKTTDVPRFAGSHVPQSHSSLATLALP